MARRRRTVQPAETSAEVAARRAHQVGKRITVALWTVEPDGGPLVEARAEAAEIADPVERLRAMLVLADEIRLLCSEDMVRWTLPESLNRWRPAAPTGDNDAPMGAGRGSR